MDIPEEGAGNLGQFVNFVQRAKVGSIDLRDNLLIISGNGV